MIPLAIAAGFILALALGYYTFFGYIIGWDWPIQLIRNLRNER